MEIKSYTRTQGTMPHRLTTIPDAPLELFAQGAELSDLIREPCLAVVGSRRVSAYGKYVTGKLVRDLAALGVVIISGLAIGIDAIAHEAAMAAGGRTIAVMPGGLGDIYPRRNRQLALRILAQSGALVSEYPPGSHPRKHHFVDRNRLVAGLSDGVLIPEAALKSGSLHTARYALEQGRTVMAVPGNINSELSEGTNNLIKTGATLVTESRDILLALGLHSGKSQDELPLKGTPEEIAILRLMRSGITSGTELLRHSGQAVAQFNRNLTMLELTGRISPVGANQWILR